MYASEKCIKEIHTTRMHTVRITFEMIWRESGYQVNTKTPSLASTEAFRYDIKAAAVKRASVHEQVLSEVLYGPQPVIE